MCGRYTLIAKAEPIRSFFELRELDERLVVPRYNIAPTQPIVVVRNGPRGRELLPMRWGLIPGFVKDPRDVSLIMARAEGIESKVSFKNAYRRRRCLIPASGFYEWQDRGKGLRQPYAVRPAEAPLIAFGGLWETWAGTDGSEIDTAAIVTVPANRRLGAIHERMPLVLAPEDFAAWLSPHTDAGEVAALLKPAPDEMLAPVPVSTRVNAVANDDPTLLDAVDPAAVAPNAAARQEPAQGSLF